MWRRRQPLPLPPPEMRDLIGGSGPDNPTGEPVYDYLPPAYEAVFDFGCGCGRVARQLIQQQPRPQRYLGVDLHAGMVEWCRRELAPHAPGFEFDHHDIYNPGLNPEGEHRTLPLPAGDGEFTLFNAISVFTHSTQDQTEHYLREAARVLRPDGWLHASWFLFDKALFPMMQPFQNALFINETDPSNAVIFDRTWVRETARDLGPGHHPGHAAEGARVPLASGDAPGRGRHRGGPARGRGAARAPTAAAHTGGRAEDRPVELRPETRARQDSNLRLLPPEGSALSTELRAPGPSGA